MQFFSKINEIVGQLSGTVERSETALEQATVALAEASAAVTEANTASAAASTAASTVAGYNTRLTAAESGVAANAANIGQLDIETQDLYDRDVQSVKLAADYVQTITGGLNLQGTNRATDTAVGDDDTKIVNGHRVIQELNAYQPMIRNTGNQTIYGVKTYENELHSYRGNYQRAIVARTNSLATAATIPASQVGIFFATIAADDGSQLAQLVYERDSTGRSKVKLTITSPSGNLYDFILGEVA